MAADAVVSEVVELFHERMQLTAEVGVLVVVVAMAVSLKIAMASRKQLVRVRVHCSHLR